MDILGTTINNQYISLEIQDTNHQYLMLKYLAKNGTITPLTPNSKFKFDSINYESKGVKRLIKSQRLPYEGNFKIQIDDLEFEIVISQNTQINNFIENRIGDCVGVSFNTPLINRIFEIKYNISDDKKILQLIEENLNKEEEEPKSTNLEIFYNEDNYWVKHAEIEHVQPFDQIFLPSTVSNEIIGLVDNFISLKDKYLEFGITYKFTFLLEGKAGMGKTSIAKSLAHKYNRRLYILNLGNRDTKENDLIKLFRDMKKDSVLVLEDIDAFFIGRKTGSECSTGVSFSTLINLLDGSLASGNGLITFITANHAKNLDDALIRPGRIDKVIRFGEMTREQFDSAWNARIKDEKPDDELYRICNRYNLSMSALMYIFFYASNNEQRRTMASESVKERRFSESTIHMYC